MSEQERNALTYIRVLAIASIVVCHIFQGYERYYFSSICNVGVQVFFLLSGFIYGSREISDFKAWSRSHLTKLYLPYIIFVVVYTLCLGGVKGWRAIGGVGIYFVNVQGFFELYNNGIWCFRIIPGLKHLWFMTAIMVAYMSIPLLQKVRGNRSVISASVILVLVYVCSICCLPAEAIWIMEWVLLFAFGYMYASLRISSRIRQFLPPMFLALLAGFVFTILHKSDLLSNYNPTNRAFHGLLGCSLFFVCFEVLSLKYSLRLPRWVAYIGTYSYCIYLVHFPLMLGPFSLLHLTEHAGLNIVLAILATGILAVALKNASDYAKNITE